MRRRANSSPTRWSRSRTGSSASSASLREGKTMSYKLLSFSAGRDARAGLLVDGKIYDAARVTGEPGWSSVLGALQDWGIACGRGTPFALLFATRLAKGVPLAHV